MELKGLIDEDFVNYKKPSMFLLFSRCSFKCDKECGREVCQNSRLTNEENINIGVKTIVDRYNNNPLTSAIVCGGLEPFDSWDDLFSFIDDFRLESDDDIVIYTGYTEEEIQDKIDILKDYDNIIIKFGRYIPNQTPHYDEVLGVKLASDNQYARRINED